MSSHTAGPRKVVVGTSMLSLWGEYPGLDKRLRQLGDLVDEMAARAREASPKGRLDLAALPEFAVNGGLKGHARQTAQQLEGPVLDAMAAMARRHECYVVAPLYMVEDRSRDFYSNVAGLLDRRGRLMGLYRFAHPSAREMAAGLTPGVEFPVFECDFGKVGLQICGDAAWDDGWRALREKGAELVIRTSQPPTPIAMTALARAHRYFIVTSTWRGSASVFGPTGHCLAEIRGPTDRVLTHEIDLSWVVLGWSPSLENGKAFDRAFGPRAGYRYWEDDDCGIFWSNDPDNPIMEMVRELGLEPLDEELQEDRRERARRRAPGNAPPSTGAT